MMRTSRVRVKFDDADAAGTRLSSRTTAEVIVRTNGKNLTRDESQLQHDAAVDRVAEAIRTLPFVGTAPLRAVEFL